MKRKLTFAFLVAIVFLVTTQMGYAVTYRKATVVDVSGMVTVLKAGGEKAVTPTVDMELEHGDRIITGKGASISLKVDEDKYIKVGEKTYMSLSELMTDAENGTSTNIKLFTGQVWASLSKPLGSSETFEIETPTAVMGAKGTKFMVKYAIAKKDDDGGDDDDQYEGITELVVLEGTVSMKTEVEKDKQEVPTDTPTDTPAGEGEEVPEPAEKQEVEILVHQNESIKVNTKLVKRIAEEIQKVIEQGTSLQDINMQEVVAKSAQIEKVAVETLDLFVLEIIEEDPEEYSDELTDNLEEVIADKQEEKEAEDAAEEEAENADSGSTIDYDDEDTGDTGDTSDTSSDTTTSSGSRSKTKTNLKLVTASILDTDANGYADHLKLTFNLSVDDASYDENLSPVIVSDELGTLYTTEFSDMTGTGISSYENDTVLYFDIDELDTLPNTGASGSLVIANAGMIDAVNGTSLPVTTLSLTDKASPQYVGCSVNLDGDAKDGYIEIEFSEALASPNEATFLDVIKIVDEESDETLDLSIEDVSLDINEGSYQITDLPLSVRTWFMTNTSPVIMIDGDLTIVDASGNTTDLSDEVFSFDSITQDMSPTYVEDVTIVKTTTSSNYAVAFSTASISPELYIAYVPSETEMQITTMAQYQITVHFSDYLDPDALADYLDNIESHLIIDAYGYVADVYSSNSSADDISFTVVINYPYDEPTESDFIEFDLDGLSDLGTYEVTTSSGSTVMSAAYSEDGVIVEEVDDTFSIDVIKTRDIDADGYVDYLEITFDEDIQDDSFLDTTSFYLVSDTLGSLDASSSQSELDSFGDVENDNVFYIAVSESVSDYNTSGDGVLYITDKGTFESVDGNFLEAYLTGVDVLDGAPPQLVDVSADLSASSTDDGLKIAFSEPVDNYSAETFFDEVYLIDSSSDASYTFDLTSSDYGMTDSYYYTVNASYGLELFLTEVSSPALAFISAIDVEDSLGNYMTIGETPFELSNVTVDETAGEVVSTEVLLDSYSIFITLNFDEYLSTDSIDSYDVYNAYSIDFQNDYGTLYNITANDDGDALTYEFGFGYGMFTSGDLIEVSLAGLTDLSGYDMESTWSQTLNKVSFEYDGSEFVEVDPMLVSGDTTFEILNASTIDADADGYLDYIMLTMSDSVDDTSFDGTLSISIDNSEMGYLNLSSLASPDTDYVYDIANDDTVYLALADAYYYNTGQVGSLYIYDTGMLTSKNGDTLTDYPYGFTIDDMAAPIFVAQDASFDDATMTRPYQEGYISFVFSEPIAYIDDSVFSIDTFFEAIRFDGLDVTGYDDAISSSYADTTMTDTGDGTYILEGIPYEFYSAYVETMGIALYMPSSFTLYDEEGNNTSLDGSYLYIDKSGATVSTTSVNLVSSEALVEDSSYEFSIDFSNYLDADTLSAVTSTYLDLYASLDMASGTADISLLGTENETPAGVSIYYFVELTSGAFEVGDTFEVELTDLLDIYGQSIFYDPDEDGISDDIVMFEFDGTSFVELIPSESTYMTIDSVVTRDEDADGYVDLLEITFSDTIDDSSFMPETDIVLESDYLGTLVATELASPTESSFTDVANDNIIYLSVLEDTVEYNTYATGTLYINAVGVVTSTSGDSLESYASVDDAGIMIEDGAPPQIVFSAIGHDGSASTSYIDIMLSEPIASPTASELFDSIAIGDATTGSYSNGIALDSTSMYTMYESDYYYAEGFSYELEEFFLNASSYYLYTDSSLVIYDEMGNYMDYSDFAAAFDNTDILLYAPEVLEATLDADISFGKITLTLSDYIDDVDIETIQADMASQLSSSLSYSSASVSAISVDYTSSSSIQVVYELDISGDGFNTGDSMTIDISALTGLNGMSLINPYNGTDYQMVTWEYTGSAFEMVEPYVVSYFNIASAETIDDDGDGYLDYLAITFTEDVSDSTFYGDGIVSIDNTALGTLNTGGISSPTLTVDYTDDATIYLSLSSVSDYNTGETGYLYLSEMGVMTSLTGSVLSDYPSGYLIEDGAAPQLVSASADLSGDAYDDIVAITFSETICCPDVYSIFDMLSLGDSTVSTFSEGYILDDYDMTPYSSSSTYYVTGLSYENEVILSDGDAYLWCDSGYSLIDASGNTTLTAETSFLVSDITEDLAATYVSDTSVVTTTTSANIVMTLPNYIDESTYISYLESFDSDSVGDFDSVTFDSVGISYDYTYPDEITLTYDYSVGAGTFTDGDYIEVDLSSLYNLEGMSVLSTYNSTDYTKLQFEYQTEQFVQVEPLLEPTFSLVSVKTLDDDSDGYLDYLELTFDSPVDDSLFMGSESITIDNANLGTLDGMSLSSPLYTTNTSYDTVVYLALTGASDYNTGEVGTLYISESGVFTSTTGETSNAEISGIAITDGAPAQIASLYADLTGGGMDNTLNISFTEAIASPSVETVFEYVMIGDDYGEYDPLAAATFSSQDDTYTQEGLSYDSLVALYSASPYMWLDQGLTLTDSNGNTSEVGDVYYDLDEIQPRLTAVNVSSATIATTTTSASIVLTLDDFIDEDAFVDAYTTLETLWIGDFDYGTVKLSSVAYEYEFPYDISLTYTFDIVDNTFTDGDFFEIDLSSLYDLAGYTPTFDYNSTLYNKVQFEYQTDDFYLVTPELVGDLTINALVKTGDDNQDGYIDYLEISFDHDVLDSSYTVTDVSLSMNDSALVIDNASLFSPTDDVADDNIIYLAITESGTYNTDAYATLVINDSGMISTSDGLSLEAYTGGISVVDAVGPVLVDVSATYGDVYYNSTLTFTFSEDIDYLNGESIYGGATLSDAIRWGGADTTDYASAETYSFTGVSEIDSGNTITFTGLSTEMIDSIINYGTLYFADGYVVGDIDENSLSIGINPITIDTIDNSALADDTEIDFGIGYVDDYAYNFILYPTEYLDETIATEQFDTALTDYVNTSLTNNNLTTLTSSISNTPSDVSITISLTTSESFVVGDMVIIDVSSLQDYFGYTPHYTYDGVEQTQIYAVYDGSNFIEMASPENTSLSVTSVAYYDFYDSDWLDGPNGYIDALRIEFDQAVLDDTYDGTYTAVIGEGSTYTISGMSIITDDVGGEAYTANDEVIYVKMNNSYTAGEYDTGDTLTFQATDSMISALNGAGSEAIEGELAVSDKAGPVLVDAYAELAYDFDSTAEADINHIGFITSEPIVSNTDVIYTEEEVSLSGGYYSAGDNSIAEELASVVRLRDSADVLTYDTATSTYDMTGLAYRDYFASYIDGYEIFLLNYESTAMLLSDPTGYGYQELFFPEELGLYDENGNAVKSDGSGSLYVSPDISSAEVTNALYEATPTTVTANTTYEFVIDFDNFLLQSSAESIFTTDCISILGDGATLSNVSFTINNTDAYDVSVTVQFDITGSIYGGEVITVDFTDLKDIYGNFVYYDDGSSNTATYCEVVYDLDYDEIYFNELALN